MKNIFTKISTCVLTASLLCSTVPAMAVGNTAPAKNAVVVAAKEVAKAAPGFLSRAIAALPTWKGTQALFSSVATAATVKNAVEFMKNHRAATIVAAVTAAAIMCGGCYKLVKYLKTRNASRAVTRLHDALVNARNALGRILKDPSTKPNAKINALVQEKAKIEAINCNGALKEKQDAFLAEWTTLAKNALVGQPIYMKSLDLIIASIAVPAARINA